MPTIGSQGWKLMLNSLEAQQVQPLLFRSETLNNQRLRAIESDISTIRKMMAKNMESNQQMRQSLEKLQHQNIVPQQ